MIGSISVSQGVVGLFERVQGVLNAQTGGRFADAREKAILRFAEVGFPAAHDEEFRYLNLRPLSEQSLELAYGATVARFDVPSGLLSLDAITLTFVNGQHAPELSSEDILPEGVYVGNFECAPELVQESVIRALGCATALDGKLGSTNDTRFVDLNTAFMSDIAVITVSEGTVLEKPIHVLNLAVANHGEFLCAPRLVAKFGANSEAKLVESFIGLGGTYFNVNVSEVVLERGAIVEHVRFQNESSTATHIGNVGVDQSEASSYTSFVANFGASIHRNDLNVWLGGSHTETRLDGVNVATGSQVMDNHTRMDHAKPECNSFEVYKSVLRDRAQGVFNGKIFVYEDAQKTDAKQTNQALLLSPTAVMNTKPQLEIFADDVKCTHGATIGQLREDARFYLQARGIPKAEADAMLVYAFANDVLNRIKFAGIREVLEARLFDKLAE
jgi:Fe-S cluster assembly protein SufD